MKKNTIYIIMILIAGGAGYSWWKNKQSDKTQIDTSDTTTDNTSTSSDVAVQQTLPKKVKPIKPKKITNGSIVYFNANANNSIVNLYSDISDTYPIQLPIGAKSTAAMKVSGIDTFAPNGVIMNVVQIALVNGSKYWVDEQFLSLTPQ